MEVKTRCVLILVSALLTCISAMEAQDLANEDYEEIS